MTNCSEAIEPVTIWATAQPPEAQKLLLFWPDLGKPVASITSRPQWVAWIHCPIFLNPVVEFLQAFISHSLNIL